MNTVKRKYHNRPEMNLSDKFNAPQGMQASKKTTNSVTPLYTKGQLLDYSPSAVPTPNLFHRVLTKMGYGPTPLLIAHIQSLAGATDNDKILSYIDEQLNPDLIDDSVVDAQLTHGYQTLNKTRTQLFQEHYRRPDGMDIPWDYHVLPGFETYCATSVRGTQSNRQLLEVMADFWHNHFNVYMDADGIPPMFVHYDRDIIRPDALGNFRSMLEGVTKATCMLDYLGNAYNHKDAPNENYAREILELHTISAENYFGHTNPIDVPVDTQGRKTGYVEADVVEMARALTGWSYSGADWEANATGEFLYRDSWHDKGDKTVMGNTYSFNAATPESDVLEILDYLAEHPATNDFLARKLCKRFISDNPPQAIIDAVKTTLHDNWQASNQIQLAMETLLKSNEFLSIWCEKIKRPFERVISSMRQIGYSYDFDPTLNMTSDHFWAFYNSGHMPFYWTSPNGYPDEKKDWLGSSSMMATWRYIQMICQWHVDYNENLPNYSDILAITLAAFPNPLDRTANNIVDYWFERACGLPPDAIMKEKLTDFMSYLDYTNPVVSDKNVPIDFTVEDWPSYNQERLFAVVSTILLTSEFNYR